MALYLLGINEIVLLFGIALVVMLARNLHRLRGSGTSMSLAFVPPNVLRLPGLPEIAATATDAYSHFQMFWSFLKIGTVLYGSGYVLLAFLESEFVGRLGWLTQEQLIDAVAVGQFTPGPVFTTATFVGYVAGGFPGAMVATAGIFLPAFIFVAISVPILPRIRKSPWTAAALDGVNVAAIGLMAGVTVELAEAAFVDIVTVIMAVIAAIALIRFRINSAWIVAAGGIIGIVYQGLVG
jgi:chromate transporter